MDPVPGGDDLTELRLVQPALMGRVTGPARLSLLATLDFEGATISEGELTAGDWGEGFIDRRHPHTYVHELLLTGDDVLGRLDGLTRISLTVGKGFAPFGTDDPMSRPVLRYPVNHHLAQVLERAVVIGAANYGPVTLEGGLFNGDEPEQPDQWPMLERVGDSWSARVTGRPLRGLELQASRAHLHSPENREGAGPDQEKWSASGRWEGPLAGHPVYGLVEWAHTSEADGFFEFSSFLAEGAWTGGRHRLHYRFERTERAEEERVSRFRTVRPHHENSTLGTTRWTIHTAGWSAVVLDRSKFAVAPLVEISYGRVAEVGGGLFDVLQTYGQDDFWSWTLGLRLEYGGGPHRMGRYGAALEGETPHRHGGEP
ncbi:MAG TPA: hypothetical protein VFR62_08355 [Gemmatimonadales bacterium]|nr:hypothetical protein [Gemmatimonadales bacterium]